MNNLGLTVLSKTLKTFTADPKSTSKKVNSQDYLMEQQRNLVDLKLIDIIGDILISSKDFEMLNASLELLNRLVEGPNKYSQTAVIDYFSHPDRSYLFSTLEKLIMTSLDGVVDVVEQINLYNLNTNLRGVTNRQEFDRIEANMQMDNFDAKMDFITHFFQCFISLMISNNQGREFMRTPLIYEFGKQHFSLTLITFSIRILSKLLKCPHSRCLKLADIILDFILECIIGPSPDNQEEVMKTHFIDCVKELLKEYGEGSSLEGSSLVKDTKLLRHLCTKAIIVIKYLLEGSRKYFDNRLKISQHLEAEFILDKLTNDMIYYFIEQKTILTGKPVKRKKEGNLNLEELKMVYASKDLIDEELTNIFEQFFVLKMILADTLGESELKNKLTDDRKITFQFLEKFSGSVEVIFENNIHKVYLEIQPLFQYMDQEEMKFINNHVRRDTHKNKLNDFLNIMPKVFDLISYKATLKRSGAFFSAQMFKNVEWINFLMISILNFFILAFFQKELYFGFSQTDPEFDETNILITIAIYAHLLVHILRVFIFLYFQCRIALMTEWRDIFEKVHSKLRQKDDSNDKQMRELSQKRFVDITLKERVLLFSKFNEIEGKSVNYPPLDFFIQCIIMVFRLPKFRLLLFYTLITIFALTHKIFFFYSLLLLDVVVTIFSLRI